MGFRRDRLRSVDPQHGAPIGHGGAWTHDAADYHEPFLYLSFVQAPCRHGVTGPLSTSPVCSYSAHVLTVDWSRRQAYDQRGVINPCVAWLGAANVGQGRPAYTARYRSGDLARTSGDWAAEMQHEVTRHTRRRALIAGCIGNLVEWYDFALYGAFATSIAVTFFPQRDPVSGLVATYLVFATAFVTRPVGALLFGHIGDRLGRRRALAAGILLMALVTAGTGLLPGYAAIGWAAPALLVLLRVGQGVAIGGEYGGSAAFVVEYAPTGRRGWYGGWQWATVGLGLAAGLGAAALLGATLPAYALHGWGLAAGVPARAAARGGRAVHPGATGGHPRLPGDAAGRRGRRRPACGDAARRATPRGHRLRRRHRGRRNVQPVLRLPAQLRRILGRRAVPRLRRGARGTCHRIRCGADPSAGYRTRRGADRYSSEACWGSSC